MVIYHSFSAVVAVDSEALAAVEAAEASAATVAVAVARDRKDSVAGRSNSIVDEASGEMVMVYGREADGGYEPRVEVVRQVQREYRGPWFGYTNTGVSGCLCAYTTRARSGLAPYEVLPVDAHVAQKMNRVQKRKGRQRTCCGSEET
jgi:hypothetical protein